MILYKDIANDVGRSLDTSNHDERRRKRPLPVRENKKKMISLMKDEKGDKIITKFAIQRQKHMVIQHIKVIMK